MSEVYDAQLKADPPPERKTSLAGLLIICLFVSLLLLPLVYAWFPGEVARWHEAAAREKWLDGDSAGAVRSLDRALELFPDRAHLLLGRAEYARRDGDFARALADCERALELAPELPAALRLHGLVLQHLGRFEEAIPNSLKRLELAQRRWGFGRGYLLNEVAYARALANSDLDQALEEVNESIELLEPSAALLDTRGFIQYLRGENEQAREDLDLAVEMVEAEHAEFLKQISGEQVGVRDPRLGRLMLADRAESVAVIRYHRSLVLAALGDEAAAEVDCERVRELGHEPGTSLF